MTWTQTYTGKAFDFMSLHDAPVCIEDVAHSLSLLCRYNGHCTTFYSVAEHAYMCALLAGRLGFDTITRFAALHHDDAEAFSGDIIRPLEDYFRIAFEGFDQFQSQIEFRCREVFGIPHDRDLAARVKLCDMAIFFVEYENLVHLPPPKPWKLPNLEPYVLNAANEVFRDVGMGRRHRFEDDDENDRLFWRDAKLAYSVHHEVLMGQLGRL